MKDKQSWHSKVEIFTKIPDGHNRPHLFVKNILTGKEQHIDSYYIGEQKTQDLVGGCAVVMDTPLLRPGKRALNINKRFFEVCGVSFSRLKKLQQNRTWFDIVAPVWEVYKLIAKPGKSWDNRLLELCWASMPLWKQCIKDGLLHIAPIVAVANTSPQELKVFFKGQWKKLTKNSKTRNGLIARAMARSSVEQWKNFQEYPSCLLKSALATRASHSYLAWASSQKGMLKAAASGQNYTLVEDTCRMAQQLGETFNPKWSLLRIKDVHSTYSRKILEKKFSPEPFKSLSWVKESQKKVSGEGCTATMLLSPLSIANEGSEMGHCVGMYARYVSEGNYLVYSFTDSAGGRLSTLGIEPGQSEGWEIQQHYGKYNRPVTCEHQKELAKKVLLLLNK